MLRLTVGDMERYGLPKPDHRLVEAHPTISDDALSRIAHGEITPKPNIAELTERTVRFTDGSEVDGRRRRLLHGLQGHVPVLRPGADRRARQRPAAVPARVPPGRRRRLLRRAAAAARRDHAARRAAVGVDLRPPRRPLPRCRRGARAARRHRGRAARDVQALRRLQAPHDAGRLRGLRAGRRAARRERRADAPRTRAVAA